jgi:hypothetical protein
VGVAGRSVRTSGPVQGRAGRGRAEDLVVSRETSPQPHVHTPAVVSLTQDDGAGSEWGGREWRLGRRIWWGGDRGSGFRSGAVREGVFSPRVRRVATQI